MTAHSFLSTVLHVTFHAVTGCSEAYVDARAYVRGSAGGPITNMSDVRAKRLEAGEARAPPCYIFFEVRLTRRHDGPHDWSLDW